MPLWSPSADPVAKVARATDGAVSILRHEDTVALQSLLASNPVAHLSAASALNGRGTAAPGKGKTQPMVLGVNGHDGALESACWLGSNIIPVCAGPEEARLFGTAARALRRRVSSIYGPAEPVLELFAATGWTNHREIRPDQPLMTITEPSALEPLPAVRRSRPEEFRAVERACAAMFAEELGFSPYTQGTSQYRDRVMSLIRAGHSLIQVDPETRRIVFKAEFGAVTQEAVQVQGVWVNPDWRGRGIAAPGMAAVVGYGLRLAPTVSLYVNSWNTAAIRTYEKVGFQQIGTYATVLF